MLNSLATVGANYLDIAERIKGSPIPLQNYLSVALSLTMCSPNFHLYNQMVYLLRQEPLAFGITELETSTLPSGLYFWEVVSHGGRAKAGKIVKTK